MSQRPITCPGCLYSGQPHLTSCRAQTGPPVMASNEREVARGIVDAKMKQLTGEQGFFGFGYQDCIEMVAAALGREK
jgi:hypothetical protein